MKNQNQKIGSKLVDGHTPTPWKLADPVHDSKYGYSWSIPIFSDKAESGDKIPAEAMASSRETARANAAFIVRAVNSHEALLRACKDALNIIWSRGANLTCEQYPDEENVKSRLMPRERAIFISLKEIIAQAEKGE